MIKIAKIGIIAVLLISFFIPWVSVIHLIGIDESFSPFQFSMAALSLIDTSLGENVSAIFILVMLIPILAVTSAFLTKYRALTIATGVYTFIILLWFSFGAGFDSLQLGAYLAYVASIALCVISFFKDVREVDYRFNNFYHAHQNGNAMDHPYPQNHTHRINGKNSYFQNPNDIGGSNPFGQGHPIDAGLDTTGHGQHTNIGASLNTVGQHPNFTSEQNSMVQDSTNETSPLHQGQHSNSPDQGQMPNPNANMYHQNSNYIHRPNPMNEINQQPGNAHNHLPNHHQHHPSVGHVDHNQNNTDFK